MVKYIQINEAGYITGVVEEPLLIGLFGGTRTMEIPDDQAPAVEELIRQHHSCGEGLRLPDALLDNPREK